MESTERRDTEPAAAALERSLLWKVRRERHTRIADRLRAAAQQSGESGLSNPSE